MIVDALTLATTAGHDADAIARDVLARADAAGVDRCVVASAAPGGTRAVVRAARDCPRLAALAHPDLHRHGPDDATAATVGGQQVCGLFVDARRDGLDLRTVGSLLAGVPGPIVVPPGTPGVAEPSRLAGLAAAVAPAAVLAATGGQANVSGRHVGAVQAALDEAANLFLLSNGLYREDLLIRAATRWPRPRILFASFSPRFDARLERFRIAAADLPRSIEEQVLGGLGAHLFAL